MTTKHNRLIKPAPTPKMRRESKHVVLTDDSNCCPKCGDTEEGFSHQRWERFGIGIGSWGRSPNDWESEGEIKPDKYVQCNACGVRIPWKTAYGEK